MGRVFLLLIRGFWVRSSGSHLPDLQHRSSLLPASLESAPRLAAAIGLGTADLWIKRDDLIGLGGGGNKIRKLEWTIGAAMAPPVATRLSLPVRRRATTHA